MKLKWWGPRIGAGSEALLRLGAGGQRGTRTVCCQIKRERPADVDSNRTNTVGTITMKRLLLALLISSVALGLSAQAWAAKIGSQFRASTFAGSHQEPSVAGLANGGFVVTWMSQDGQDGSGDGIYAQLFSPAGSKAGIEFKVNTHTTNNQSFPAVAALNNGGFVVAWQSEGQDGSGAGVYGQRYNAAGARAGNEFRANTSTPSNQDHPSVAGLANGGFVVTWTSLNQDGDGAGIYGQRYGSTGARAGVQFRVNTYTTSNQERPSVAGLTNGGFVVTWQSDGQDGDANGIYGQRYSAAGARAGVEFRVNTPTVGGQDLPSVAGLTNGGFVVTWESSDGVANGGGIYGQRYTAAGARAGGNFRVNTYTSSNQAAPSVAALNDGDFVVTWNSDGQDGYGYGVYGQRFRPSGARVGPEFPVNTTTLHNQIEPSVAPFGNDGFVVVWRLHTPGSGAGIFGQRFGP